MTNRAVDFVHREDQARQRDCFFVAAQLFDLFPDSIELESVVSLPRFLCFTGVMLCKPSVLAGKRVEMVDQLLVALARMRIQQVTFTEDPGPYGDVVGNYAIAALRERLRNACRA